MFLVRQVSQFLSQVFAFFIKPFVIVVHFLRLSACNLFIFDREVERSNIQFRLSTTGLHLHYCSETFYPGNCLEGMEFVVA